jgi:hypothetical protein
VVWRFARAAACTALVLATIGGCSWIGVTSPKKQNLGKATAKPECTESVSAPVVDTVAAAAYAAIAITGLVGLAEQDSNDCANSGEFCLDLDFSGLFITMAAIGGIGAAVHTGSAAYGYSSTSDCREAVQRWEARARTGPAKRPRAPARQAQPTLELLP